MALKPLHSRDSKPKGSNGPVGKPKLHPGPSGSGGHPVKGKGIKLGGAAY